MEIINYNNEKDSRREYLTNLEFSNGSSKSAKTINWHSEYVKRKICCEKGDIPEQNEVLPVQLYSEVAGCIIDLFEKMNSRIPTQGEIAVSGLLVSKMKTHYDTEDKRVDAFLEAVRHYIPWEKTGTNATGYYKLRQNNGPDAFMTCPVAGTKIMALISLIEVKQEIGSSANPTVQINLDYSRLSGKMSGEDISRALPCLVSGTLVTIQLAVIGKYVTIHSLIDGF